MKCKYKLGQEADELTSLNQWQVIKRLAEVKKEELLKVRGWFWGWCVVCVGVLSVWVCCVCVVCEGVLYMWVCCMCGCFVCVSVCVCVDVFVCCVFL